MTSDPSAAPPAVRPFAAALVRAVIGGGSGRLLVGALFALTLVGLAGRARGASAAAIPAPPPTLRVLPFPPRDAAAQPETDATPGEVDALALDALLARYDALIRMAERRAITSRTPSADQELRTLRRLRAETYEAARQAFPSSASHSDHRTRTPSG